VDLKVEKDCPSVFLRGIDSLHIPVAHGEGNFYASPENLAALESRRQVAMRYVKPDGSPSTGRIMGMMPHPERGMLFSQRDDWTLLREDYRRNGKELPLESDGMVIFRNAVEFFSN
jgi:phosphoribosylformylglycinamidine synthase